MKAISSRLSHLMSFLVIRRGRPSRTTRSLSVGRASCTCRPGPGVEPLEPRLLLSSSPFDPLDTPAPLSLDASPVIQVEAASKVNGDIGLGQVKTTRDAGSSGAPVLLEASGLPSIQKTIVAGDPVGTPSDSPSNRVDANTTSSPYAGVGSLAIQNGPNLFICTATAISPNHVLTAAH